MKDRDKVGNETMTINILNTQQSMLKATLVSDQWMRDRDKVGNIEETGFLLRENKLNKRKYK